MKKNGRAVFDDERKQAVRRQLKHFSIADCLLAVDGCAMDPFSMGENDRHRPYNDLALIFRDAEHVEKFIAIAKAARSEFEEVKLNEEGNLERVEKVK